jgi:hypothetical protein
MITLKLTKTQARVLRQACYSAVQNEEALIDAYAPQYGIDSADFKRVRKKTQKLVDAILKLDKLIVDKMLEQRHRERL